MGLEYRFIKILRKHYVSLYVITIKKDKHEKYC